MKAILSYSLYRRPKATNEEDAIGYLSAGSVIEVSRIEAGKMLDGISIWFFAEDGFYYWGGGVQFSDEQVFGEWQGLNREIKLAMLTSIISDKAFWIEKKVIGAVGFAIGFKNDTMVAGLALSIFVDKKVDNEQTAKTVNYLGIRGLPIDIKVAGIISHNGTEEMLTPDEDLPMRMGGSISVVKSQEFGTRGLFLIKNKKQFVLTCFHVLLSEFFPKNTLYQGLPTRIAEYPSPVKNTSVEVKTGLITYGCYNNNNDFAIVKMENKNEFLNGFGRRRFKGFYDADTLPSLLHKNVITAGAVTNIKQGKVLDTNGKVVITNTGQRFENVVVTEKISLHGDSGAPVVDENNKVVGIVIASDEIERSYVLPIYNLLILNGYAFN